MPNERPDRVTPCTVLEMAGAMSEAALNLAGADLTPGEIPILVGHSAFETGFWAKMHGYNVGNAKSVPGDGCDWSFFECGEELHMSLADQLMSESPLVSLVRRYVLDGIPMASVILRPKHPGCRFRSFESLEKGAENHLQLLLHRFGPAWAALPAGPAAFVHALKLESYFSLDEPTYLARMLPCVDRVRKELAAAAETDPGEIVHDSAGVESAPCTNVGTEE